MDLITGEVYGEGERGLRLLRCVGWLLPWLLGGVALGMLGGVSLHDAGRRGRDDPVMLCAWVGC